MNYDFLLTNESGTPVFVDYFVEGELLKTLSPPLRNGRQNTIRVIDGDFNARKCQFVRLVAKDRKDEVVDEFEGEICDKEEWVIQGG